MRKNDQIYGWGDFINEYDLRGALMELEGCECRVKRYDTRDRLYLVPVDEWPSIVPGHTVQFDQWILRVKKITSKEIVLEFVESEEN